LLIFYHDINFSVLLCVSGSVMEKKTPNPLVKLHIGSVQHDQKSLRLPAQAAWLAGAYNFTL
jgi:hypothetical protein